MGCCGPARWKREEVPDHKFDFIDVRDYWSNGYITRIKYAFLFANLGKSFAVYVADIYTAITLLAFHKFNGTIYNRVANSPTNTVKVPFDYGKWIFTGCIIFSFLLLAYEAHKARAVVRSRDISYAYTNVMANDYYSIRSYNHFCFFCQINNSKKKKDEVAFFIFFTFKGWKRLLVADGPRQVINALTLYALAEASGFSTNLQDYYEGNIFTLVMLLTMLFTVLVFAGSAFLLFIAALMYLPLICYIQGNLKEYCCHKIDKRISELVQKKKKQRLGKYAAIARAEAAGDFSHLKNKKGEIVRRKMLQPTLPNLDINLMEDDYGAKKKLDRSNSISSSIATGAMYGGEKNLYSMKEGDDYASTAQLVMNQGRAGSVFGHAYGNGSVSTIEGAPSLPPTMHTSSPDAYPMQVRGMQGVQDVMRTQGLSSSASILAEMGAIGTSPDLMARRMVGRGAASVNGSQGEVRERYEEMNTNASYMTRAQDRAKSPLSAQGQDGNSYYGFHEMQQQQQQSSDQLQYHNTYPSREADYRSNDQMTGIASHDYPPHTARQQEDHTTNAAPVDLSSYAPYQEDGYLAPNQYGDQHDPNRPHSFSDVYEAYYNDHNGNTAEAAGGDGFGGGTPSNDPNYQDSIPHPRQEQYYQHHDPTSAQSWQSQEQYQVAIEPNGYADGYARSQQDSQQGSYQAYPQHSAGQSHIDQAQYHDSSADQNSAPYYQQHHHNDQMYNYQAR